MAIQYPVRPDSRWAFYDQAADQVISRNKPWPVADGGPIPGADPNIVPLLDVQHLPETHPDHAARPVYDARLFVLQIDNTVDAGANRLEVSYTTPARNLEERKVAAENREAEEVDKHLPIERELIETRLMLAAILEYLDGSQWPPKVQNMADRYRAKGVKLWKNRDRLKAILSEIEAGQAPDLDAGWETPDPE